MGAWFWEVSGLLCVVNFVIIESVEHVLVVFEAVSESLEHQGGVDNAILLLELGALIGEGAGVRIIAKELGDTVAAEEE